MYRKGKPNMKLSKLFLLSAVITAMILASCSSDDPIKERNKAIEKLYKKNTVKVALVTSYGEETSQEILGVQLALKKIRQENICSKNIELVTFEDNAKPAKAMNIAYQIAADKGISTVIGHDYSDISIPCSVIYQYYGILMLNPDATAPTLTNNKNDLIFRNIPTDTDSGTKVAELCQQNNFNNILIYNANSAYGNSLANAFEFVAGKADINVVNRDSFERKSPESTFNQKIRSWTNNYIFDAIFLAATEPDISVIINCIRNNGITVPVIGADSFENPKFLQNLSTNENNRLFAVSNFNINSENPEFRSFRKEFKEEYQSEPDLNACQGYDFMMVYAKALQKANSAIPEKVAQVMMSQSWNEAAGPYTFTENGDINGKKIFIKKFKDGMLIEE